MDSDYINIFQGLEVTKILQREHATRPLIYVALVFSFLF